MRMDARCATKVVLEVRHQGAQRRRRRILPQPAGTAAATRSAKLGVRERQHERTVLRCCLRQLASLPTPRCARPSPGRLSGRSALSLGLPRGMAIGCASFRASHPGKPRRNSVGLNQRFPWSRHDFITAGSVSKRRRRTNFRDSSLYPLVCFCRGIRRFAQ